MEDEDVKWDNQGTTVKARQRTKREARDDAIHIRISRDDKLDLQRWANSLGYRPVELLESLIASWREGRIFIVDQGNLLISLQNHLIDAARDAAKDEAERYLHQTLYEKGIIPSPFRT